MIIQSNMDSELYRSRAVILKKLGMTKGLSSHVKGSPLMRLIAQPSLYYTVTVCGCIKALPGVYLVLTTSCQLGQLYAIEDG